MLDFVWAAHAARLSPPPACHARVAPTPLQVSLQYTGGGRGGAGAPAWCQAGREGCLDLVVTENVFYGREAQVGGRVVLARVALAVAWPDLHAALHPAALPCSPAASHPADRISSLHTRVRWLSATPPHPTPTRSPASTTSRARSATATRPTTPAPQVRAAGVGRGQGAGCAAVRPQPFFAPSPRLRPLRILPPSTPTHAPAPPGAVLLDENLRELNLSAPTLVGPRAFARLQRALWSGALVKGGWAGPGHPTLLPCCLGALVPRGAAARQGDGPALVSSTSPLPHCLAPPPHPAPMRQTPPSWRGWG